MFHPKVCEGFFVVDADVAKDSSTELTVLEQIIDFAMESLNHRNIQMPEHLVIEVGSLGLISLQTVILT